MPEQNTPVPIKYEDIQKGDRIRRTEAIEYTAAGGPEANAQVNMAYELISRPVPLPTEPGWYVARPDADNYAHLQLCDDAHCKDSSGGPHWFRPDQDRVISDEDVSESYMPLVRFAAVSTTAAEVLADVRNIFGPGALLLQDVDKIAAKYGVTP